MKWVYPTRRGPQWKQGWTGQTLSSISAPPLPLLTIFGIVIVLLWFSQYTDNKAQLHHTAINFQLFLLLLPILLIFFMISFSYSERFAFWPRRLEHETVHRSGDHRGALPCWWGFFLCSFLINLHFTPNGLDLSGGKTID